MRTPVTNSTASNVLKNSSPTLNRENSTRAGILRAAADLILETGYEACTMRSISDRVQIQAGSLYHHFPSKDEIIIETLNLGVSMLLERVRRDIGSMPKGSDWQTKVRTAIYAHVACKTDRSTPFIRIFEHVPTNMRHRCRKLRHEYTALWFELIEEGRQTGEFRNDLELDIFVPYFVTGLNRLMEWYDHSSMSAKHVTDTIAQAFFDGIFHRPSGNGRSLPSAKALRKSL